MGDFVRFEFSGKTLRNRLSVNSNYIGFNKAAGAAFDLSSYKYAVLFYDEQDFRIGIMPTNNEAEVGVRTIRTHKTGSVSIACKNFIERYQLFNKDIGVERYPCKYDEGSKMVIADMKEK